MPKRGHVELDEHDTNAIAVAMLRLVAHEHADELARGLEWPPSPGFDMHAAARHIAHAARFRSPS